MVRLAQVQIPQASPLAKPNTELAQLPEHFPSTTIPGLYVHIPFCFHKCHYCDFYSITRQTPQRMSRFVDLLLREADRWSDSRSGPTVSPQTIFFGGGTPSLLPPDDMRRLIRGLHDRFDIQSPRYTSASLEWTVECNPATVTPEYCAMLREEGVNRLSFGAQSFDPQELKTLERHHDPADVARSIAIARAAGFDRLNVDLIYAIPGQSFESWQDSLKRAIALNTEHISCYALTYEPNTPMAVKKRLGQITATPDDLELRMLHHTRQRLVAAGYQAYEISNYARPGEPCRHNLLYWNGGSYIGLGPSAASHIEGWRWKNRPHLGEWESAVESSQLPAADIEHLTPLQRLGEIVMLQLRLQSGVHLPSLNRLLQVDAERLYRDLVHRLLIANLLAGDESRFHLTDRGIELADAIAAEFVALSGE